MLSKYKIQLKRAYQVIQWLKQNAGERKDRNDMIVPKH